MSRNTRAASSFMRVVKSDGTFPAAGSLGRGSHTLAAGTYYVELGGSDYSSLECAQFRWSAALAATITIESTNLAEKDASITSTDATAWLQENPSTSGITVAGGGNTISGLTVTAGGSNAGGVLLHLGNMGAARLRAKLVVGTQGDFQASVMGKQ